MLNRKYRTKILFATLLLTFFATGCTNESTTETIVGDSASATKDPTKLDAFYIAFSPGSDETERTFSWHTPKTNKEGFVELRLLDEEGNVLSTEIFEATVADTQSGYSTHEASVSGLEPNQFYTYRFGDGYRAWSESYSFRTQEAWDGAFNLLFFGDPQIGAGDGTQIDEDVLAFRDGLVPVFDELDIDVALMGHDHVYVRTYQMKGDAVVEEIAYDEAGAAVDPEGTLYLTGNSASDSKYYDMQDSSVYERYAAVALQLEEPTFMNVEVTDDSLTFTTYKTADQSVVDAYSIVKVDSGE